jgi:RNA recognition motif-containing protein
MISLSIDQLPFDVTEEDVRPLLEPFGAVHSIIIGLNRDLGEHTGFALVDLDTTHTGVAAAMDGQTVRGQTIRVREVRDDPQRRHFTSVEQSESRA